MVLYISVQTQLPDIYVDYIEVELNTGEIVSLNWDESEIERFNGGFRAKYSRVCMGESYAEGQLVKLHDMKIATVGIYSGFDHLDSIIIEEMEFEDGEEIYEPTHILPYAVNTEECDRT